MIEHMEEYFAPPPHSQFSGFTPAERIARLLHESYERHACAEYGYLPRLWEQLLPADQALQIAVAQELITREMLYITPDCTHPATKLVRLEAAECVVCHTYPRLTRNSLDPEENHAVGS